MWSRKLVGLVFVPLALAVTIAATARADGARLVGEWRFDEPSGDIAVDTSGSGFDAQLGDGSQRPTRIAGIQGRALRFDGGSDGLGGDDVVTVLRDPAALEPPHISVAASVRAANSPGLYRYVVSKGSNRCLSSSYGLYSGANGGAVFYVRSSSGFVTSPAARPGAVWDGTWHRLVGTFDGASVRLFLDGVEIGTAEPYKGDVVYGLASRSALIGSYRGDCTLPFTGDIDTVRIWNGALSPAQIAADARPPAAGGGGSTGGGSPGGGTAGGGGAAGGGGSAGGGGTAGGGTSGGAATDCTTVRVSHRRLRAGRRARLVVSVRTGAHRRKHVRVTVRAKRLRLAARTGRRGTATFRLRPRRAQRRLTVRAAVKRVRSCPAPATHVRVAR